MNERENERGGPTDTPRTDAFLDYFRKNVGRVGDFKDWPTFARTLERELAHIESRIVDLYEAAGGELETGLENDAVIQFIASKLGSARVGRSPWRTVEEAAPPEDRYVFVLHENGDIGIDRRVGGEWFDYTADMEHYEAVKIPAMSCGVTPISHWMPPPPPAGRATTVTQPGESGRYISGTSGRPAPSGIDAERDRMRGPFCVACDGCGWCEGSPAFTCEECHGTGLDPLHFCRHGTRLNLHCEECGVCSDCPAGEREGDARRCPPCPRRASPSEERLQRSNFEAWWTGFGAEHYECDACTPHDACHAAFEAGIAYAAADAPPGERLPAILKAHWLTSITCNHEAKTDVANCWCGKWQSEPQPSVGAAVDRWIEHVMVSVDYSGGPHRLQSANDTPSAMDVQGVPCPKCGLYPVELKAMLEPKT